MPFSLELFGGILSLKRFLDANRYTLRLKSL